jgi:NTP pyrophosphatase (non-canonical NTP hydrolase)
MSFVQNTGPRDRFAGPEIILASGQELRYGAFVSSRIKLMETTTLDLLHAAVGISGEAGELLDSVKKHWAYNQPVDLANLIEELGDLEFYMAAMRLVLGISRDQILQTNVDKLVARYPVRYTDALAAARADKAAKAESDNEVP